MYSWLTEEREIAAEGRKVMAVDVCVCVWGGVSVLHFSSVF